MGSRAVPAWRLAINHPIAFQRAQLLRRETLAPGSLIADSHPTALPPHPTAGIPGASTLNFFVDFPAEAARNDVTLPEGRVFFRCACFSIGSQM